MCVCVFNGTKFNLKMGQPLLNVRFENRQNGGVEKWHNTWTSDGREWIGEQIGMDSGQPIH